MVPVILDAIRVAEREMLSARADAPVIVENTRSRQSILFSTRVAFSSLLHRAAETVAPRGDVTERRFSPDPCTGC